MMRSLLLFTATVAACAVPTRRASRIDPAITLRERATGIAGRGPAAAGGAYAAGDAVPGEGTDPLRMLVHIPKEQRGHAYQAYVTQYFREEEVGRVTWQLMKRRKD